MQDGNAVTPFALKSFVRTQILRAFPIFIRPKYVLKAEHVPHVLPAHLYPIPQPLLIYQRFVRAHTNGEHLKRHAIFTRKNIRLQLAAQVRFY